MASIVDVVPMSQQEKKNSKFTKCTVVIEISKGMMMWITFYVVTEISKIMMWVTLYLVIDISKITLLLSVSLHTSIDKPFELDL